jgi:hypothetical protein
MTAGVANTSASEVSRHIGGAKGARGFLKWVEASFPAPVASQVLKSAARQSGGLGRLGRLGLGLVRRPSGFARRRLSGLGQSGDVMLQDISFDSSQLVQPTISADTTGATDAAASPSWLSSLGGALSGAISAAGQVYLTKSQVDAANQIMQINLQRAQQGLAPLPYTPQQLGLTGPTLNLGLSQSTLTPILWIVGGIGAIALISGMGRRSSSRR